MKIALLALLIPAPALAGPEKFTTKTTALYPSKACKTKIAGAEGSDPVLRCPGLKGFDVEVSFSATDTLVTVSNGEKPITFSGQVGKQLEWQLVNGKPFAVLVEVGDYDDGEGKPKTVNLRVELAGVGPLTRREKVAMKSASAVDKKQAWVEARNLATASYKQN
jgi:hypothetical protein